MRVFWIQFLAMICAVSAAVAAPPDTGRILCAYWREIAGTQVADLTSLPGFPDYPHEQVYLEQFEIPVNQEGNYGTLIRGYVHPPTDGAYTFYIAGNSQAELWLSEDVSPEHKRLIASAPQWTMPRAWEALPQQKSAPVQLKAGGVYYIEARHKNGGGDNHMAVAWRWPDGTMEGPIAGKWLSPVQRVDVPAPRVRWELAPAATGVSEAKAKVSYLNQQFPLSVAIRVPAGGRPRRPAVVYLADGDDEKPLPAIRPAGAYGEFVEIAPKLGQEQSYDQRAMIKVIVAVVEDLCRRQLSVDPAHVGLVGVSSGGTAAWKVAAGMPDFFHGVAVISGCEVREAQVPERLRHTRVMIVTDVTDGMGTEFANRMQARLARSEPKPQIVYLHEEELGKASAAEYCLTRPAVYEFAMGYEKPAAPQGNTGSGRHAWMRPALAGGLVVILIGATIFWRRRSRDAN